MNHFRIMSLKMRTLQKQCFFQHYLRLLIIGTLFWINFSFADSLEQINQERQNNRKAFLSSLNHIQFCRDKAQNLSDRVSALEQDLSRKHDFYQNIHTEEDFQKGLRLRKKAQADIKDIKGQVRVLKRKCKFFVSDSIVSQLDLSLKALKKDLWSLNYDQEWIETTKQMDQKIHTKYKLGNCISDLNTPAVKVFSWSSYVDLAYHKGDMFMMSHGLANLKVLNDYITNVVSACDIEGTMRAIEEQNMSPTIKELNQKIIAGMQKDVQSSHSKLKEATEKYGALNFEELSVKMCQQLKEMEKDQAGICSAPLDNPSWHYSVSYFLNAE